MLRFATRAYSVLSTSLRAHPKLYAHHNSTQQAMYVSLAADGCALPLGWCDKGFVAEYRDGGLQGQTLARFHENPKFLDILAQTLAAGVHRCAYYRDQARAQWPAAEYFHVFDLRNAPAYGRIPEVEDILGTVRVGGAGEIQAHTYEHNRMYRPLTLRGFCVLPDDLDMELAKVTRRGPASDLSEQRS